MHKHWYNVYAKEIDGQNYMAYLGIVLCKIEPDEVFLGYTLTNGGRFLKHQDNRFFKYPIIIEFDSKNVKTQLISTCLDRLAESVGLWCISAQSRYVGGSDVMYLRFTFEKEEDALLIKMIV